MQDREGTAWSCAQAYAGLDTGEGGSEAREGLKQQAAHVNGREVEVVCTPSGGATTVRLTLADDWQEQMSDEELADRIEQERTR